MPPVVPSHKHRPYQAMAAAQNGFDALSQQQPDGISAPTPGDPILRNSNSPVMYQGVIPTTPAGTPGPDPAVARYGMQFFGTFTVGDGQAAVRQVQIDQWGWHKYNNVGGVATYASELVKDT